MVVVVAAAVAGVVRSPSSRLVFVFRMFTFMTYPKSFGLTLERKFLFFFQNSEKKFKNSKSRSTKKLTF